jgi:hypothetical protein
MTASLNYVVGGGGGSDKIAKSTVAKVMTNGDTIFTVTGDILVFGLASECYTANGASATTIQYQVVNAGGTATMSGVSASLANAAAGTSVVAQLGTLANAPVVTAAVGVGVFPWGAVRIPGGSTINLVVATGPTTGTWSHYITYKLFEAGATVVAA